MAPCPYIRAGPTESLSWLSVPLSLSLAVPYIVSQLVDSIEIHDLSSLNSVQRIPFNSPTISVFCFNRSVYMDSDPLYQQQLVNSNEYNYQNEKKSSSSSGTYGADRTVTCKDLPHVFVSTVGRTNDQLFVLRMTPLIDQVSMQRYTFCLQIACLFLSCIIVSTLLQHFQFYSLFPKVSPPSLYIFSLSFSSSLFFTVLLFYFSPPFKSLFQH